MIGFVLVLSLLIGSAAQACQEAVSTAKQKSEPVAIKADGQAQLVTSDKAKQAKTKENAPKKEKKNNKAEESTQAPVTSSIFAKKTLSTMNFEELKKSKIEHVKAGDKKTAIKYLERMNRVCNDINELKEIMLELAQLLYDIEDYTKASKMYHDFTLLYPGSDEVEFAMYQAVTSSFKQIRDAEHDQTNTMETKELAQSFLERSSFTKYKNDVEKIAVQCDERLLESEINIFNFYMKRGNYIAAKTRLASIKEGYLEKAIPGVQMRVADLEKNYTNATCGLEIAPTTVVAVQDKIEEKIEDRDKKSLVDRF